MDAPSKELLHQLHTLGLATERDLSQCRRHVRLLARDLPLFDSVWLDALVRLGVLTPFQSRRLQAGHADSLRIDQYTLVEEVLCDGLPRMHLARGPQREASVFLATAEVPSHHADTTHSALSEVVTRLQAHPMEGLSVPLTSGRQGECAYVVSPAIQGRSLQELLVRHGRIAPSEVVNLARLLLRTLAGLHARGLLHGDVRLRNVWVDEAGNPVLMNPALTATVRPSVSMHEAWPIEALDGVAPEIIGPRGARMPHSDLYSLGMTLWQLLAGRPPHATADPISKLIAHQNRDIVDIRRWAPDTPATLATLIEALVRRDPSQRPASADEALSRLGKPSRSPRKTRPAMAALPPRSPRPTRPGIGRNATLAVCAVIGLGTTIGLIQRSGAVPDPLSLPAPRTALLDPDAGTPTGQTQHKPLPTPVNGLIVLDDAGPWQPGKISAIGPVVIRAAGGVRPVIEIDQSPLQIWAERVLISGVEFRKTGSSTGVQPVAAPASLLSVDAQQLQLERCRFIGPAAVDADSETAIPALPAIRWTLIDEAGLDGRLLLKDVELTGDLRGIEPLSNRGSIACDHVLKHGRGELISLAAPSGRPQAREVHLRRTTLRGTIPLVRSPALRSADALSIHCDHCVFGLEQAALLETSDSSGIDTAAGNCTLEVRASLLSLGSPLRASRDPQGILQTSLSAEAFPAELIVDELQFADAPADSWNAHRLTGTTIPLSEETPPGIGASPL